MKNLTQHLIPRIAGLLALVLAANPAWGEPKSSTLTTLAGNRATVISHATSPDGKHWGAVLQMGDHQVLVVDEQPVADAPEIPRFTISDNGKPVYWSVDGDEHFLHSPSGVAGPFDAFHTPDLRALVGYGEVRPDDWDFRGGARVVFGARSRDGDWRALFRYPAEPQAQEEQPLGTTRSMVSGSDPTLRKDVPLGFARVRPAVPFAIAADGNDECVIVGATNYGCGQQVVMLAFAPATGRIAFALKRPDGIHVNSGHRWYGPTQNLDWVSFSPDGKHLAFVTRDDASNALVQDDLVVATYPRIEAPTWFEGNRLAFIAHIPDRSLVLVDGKPLHEFRGVTGLYRSPTDKLHVAGYDSEGRFLLGLAGNQRFESLWQEGFLADGRPFAAASFKQGGKGFAVADRLTPPMSGIERIESAPGNRSVVVIAGKDGRRYVTRDGQEWFDTRAPVRQILWCDSNAYAQYRRGEEDIVTNDAGAVVARCQRLLFGVCSRQTLVPVCLVDGKYVSGSDGKQQVWDELPLALAYGQAGGTRSAFATRRDRQWYVSFGEQTVAVVSKPSTVHPTQNGPWYLVAGNGYQQWVTSQGTGAEFTSVTMPVFHQGHSVYRARKDGKESYVVDGTPVRWAGRIVTPPWFFTGGLQYWVETEEGLGLESVAY